MSCYSRTIWLGSSNPGLQAPLSASEGLGYAWTNVAPASTKVLVIPTGDNPRVSARLSWTYVNPLSTVAGVPIVMGITTEVRGIMTQHPLRYAGEFGDSLGTQTDVIDVNSFYGPLTAFVYNALFYGGAPIISGGGSWENSFIPTIPYTDYRNVELPEVTNNRWKYIEYVLTMNADVPGNANATAQAIVQAVSGPADATPPAP